MRFSWAGRSWGNLPNNIESFSIFFGRLGPHRPPPPARVRHERPPFSTNSFTHVVILDSQTQMGPKGKRNRRGVLLSLLHCLPQTPDTPRTPAHGLLIDGCGVLREHISSGSLKARPTSGPGSLKARPTSAPGLRAGY